MGGRLKNVCVIPLLLSAKRPHAHISASHCYRWYPFLSFPVSYTLISPFNLYQICGSREKLEIKNANYKRNVEGNIKDMGLREIRYCHHCRDLAFAGFLRF